MTNRTLCLGFLTAATLMASSYAADAAVYCKYVGVPKGCVVRAGIVLAPAPVVVAPAAVVVATPGVGVRPGVGVNRGGPVNRVGRR